MHAPAERMTISKTSLWSGRIVTAVVILFMIVDGGIKVLKLAPAVEGTTRLGYPAILGAILLTGYVGGATATQVRLEDPWFFFPVAIGGLAWLGIFLRDERLRSLIPLRKS